MNFDLNKSEFRDAVKLRYEWDVRNMPSVCICEDHFNVDHAMICKRGGFVIQRHNELRDLEAEMLRMVCNGVETEPMGVARIFQRGGHTDSYIGHSPNCHLNIVGCLLTKRLTKGGSRAPQDPPPWLRPWNQFYKTSQGKS